MRTVSKGAPFLAAAFVLLLFAGGAARAETDTQGETQVATQGTSGLTFSFVPVPVAGAQGYKEGTGSADLQAQGTAVTVQFQAEQMAPAARFMLSMTVNGTSRSVANMTTDGEGEVEAEAVIPLEQGTYGIGLVVYDLSTFASPEVVMQSSPASASISLAGSSGTSSSQGSEDAQTVSAVSGSQAEDDGIRTAILSGVIPVVVQVEDSGTSTYAVNSSFSVSVGSYRGDGFAVSLSAKNVTGPRVLLVNLTSASSRSLFTSSILVTLDGSPVQQAASVSEVLAPQAGSPPRFVMVSGASGLRLLVSIPHFSSHVVEILPVAGAIGAVLLADLPILLVSVAVVSLVVVSAYARRVRVTV